MTKKSNKQPLYSIRKEGVWSGISIRAKEGESFVVADNNKSETNGQGFKELRLCNFEIRPLVKILLEYLRNPKAKKWEGTSESNC